MKIEKEEIKLSLFTDYIFIYAENPKNLSKMSEYRSHRIQEQYTKVNLFPTYKQ